MNTTTTAPTPSAPPIRPPRRSRLQRVLFILLAIVVALVLLVVLFPWDWLRGPVNRYVSEKTGRKFEITRHLDVKLGRTTRIVMDGIEFANPAWAREPYLVKAERAEVGIRLWPLLKKQVVLPFVVLKQPAVNLQVQPDGQRSWAFGDDTGSSGTAPNVGHLELDNGTLTYLAADKGADIAVRFQYDGDTRTTGADVLPLRYDATGQWRKQPFSAKGRTGNVLQLSAEQIAPFPVEIDARAGATRLVVKGSIGNLEKLEGIDAEARMQGQNLSDLYEYIGVVLPSTPPYALKARVKTQHDVWAVEQLQGKIGNSDLAGDLKFDKTAAVPSLTGDVRSQTLDFDDLGPLIGMAPSSADGGNTSAAGDTPAVTKTRARKPVPKGGKVLPATPLDFSRLKAMNADVRYEAKRIQHIKELPLDSAQAHVVLKDGALALDPLRLGVAGGTLAGAVRVDSGKSPAAVTAKLEARAMKLQRLFPAIEKTKGSFGNVTARVDLAMQGNTVAAMLGHASGDVGVLLGRGEFSNILLEFIGLDGGEVLKFFLGGDRNVRLRCGAAAFDVKDGLMTSKAIVVDTTDTVVDGEGTINLGTEALHIVLKPQPKDKSILSLRSPLIIQGTLGDPSAFPDKGALAGRAALAVVLGAINPFLALAATIETGPGEDADCKQVLAQTPAPAPKPQ
ncbi:membrane assembly protein AsmA [Xylophilus sp. Leaf220]|nr:membrane assembly protein AsmA [Xylophilus sp. Leaf220]